MATSSYSLLACKVSAEKAAYCLLEVALYVAFHFSLLLSKFSLPLPLDNSNIMSQWRPLNFSLFEIFEHLESGCLFRFLDLGIFLALFYYISSLSFSLSLFLLRVSKCLYCVIWWCRISYFFTLLNFFFTLLNWFSSLFWIVFFFLFLCLNLNFKLCLQTQRFSLMLESAVEALYWIL